MTETSRLHFIVFRPLDSRICCWIVAFRFVTKSWTLRLIAELRPLSCSWISRLLWFHPFDRSQVWFCSALHLVATKATVFVKWGAAAELLFFLAYLRKLFSKINFFVRSSKVYARGSQTFSGHVPLQHFDRWARTPKMSYDKKAEEIKNIFTNMLVMILKTNIHWYMYKYFEINNIQTYVSFLLLTFNVPLQIGKCTPWGTCTPVWEPLVYALSFYVLPWLLWDEWKVGEKKILWCKSQVLVIMCIMKRQTVANSFKLKSPVLFALS